jgi:hypothetical protein
MSAMTALMHFSATESPSHRMHLRPIKAGLLHVLIIWNRTNSNNYMKLIACTAALYIEPHFTEKVILETRA